MVRIQPLNLSQAHGPGLALPEDEVHVYWLECDSADGAGQWLGLLSPEELERHGRFVFEKDRRLFLLAHATARLVLARYTDCDPKSLEFDVNAYGKPRLRPRAGSPCPGFNLSHTHGLVAVAVAHEEDIGVDVENSQRTTGWADLVKTVFTPEEQAELWRCPAGQRQQRFYELWTLKEAYIKARGMGLSLPLQGFSIRMPENRPIGIAFGEEIADDPSGWRFELFAVETFRLALAIRARNRKQWTVRLLSAQTAPAR
jgi:4'-phosphopantetheinyl transferase